MAVVAHLVAQWLAAGEIDPRAVPLFAACRALNAPYFRRRLQEARALAAERKLDAALLRLGLDLEAILNLVALRRAGGVLSWIEDEYQWSDDVRCVACFIRDTIERLELVAGSREEKLAAVQRIPWMLTLSQQEIDQGESWDCDAERLLGAVARAWGSFDAAA